MLSRRLALLTIPFAVLLACGSDDPAATPGGGASSGTTSSGGTSSSGGSSSSSGGTAPTPIPDAQGDPCRGIAVPKDGYVPSGMCARLVAKGTAVSGIRQIMFASNGDLFAQTGGGQILLLRDENNDGTYSKTEVHAWATTDGNGNNAHIDEAGGYVYAGSTDGEYRFTYDATKVEGGPVEKVVIKQPAGGHGKHTTHVYDGMLYVHSGSAGNMTHESQSPIGEYDTNRSLIRRFDLSKYDPTKPFEWLTGEIVTQGLRNANGFKRNEITKKIYAVVNGLDDISYNGTNVHEDNPGEQILEIVKGNNYGYPFCFTAQRVPQGASVIAPGTQLINAAFAQGHDDAWCAANSLKPTTFVQAHSAPLDLAFFDNQPKGNLPEKYRGGAFIAFHGSWDRSQATGYKVVWQPFNADGSAPNPTSDATTTTFPYEVIFGGADDAGKPQDGSWQWASSDGNDSPRPTGVAISPIDGSLYIASDNNGTLYRVGVQK
jgi:glucose/arabinose dehydrogenase